MSMPTFNLSAYIALDNEEAANRVVRAAHSTFELLARNPGAGRLRRWAPGFRAFPISGFPNYLVVYRECEDTVEIHRVVHGAQNLEELFQP